MKSRDLTRSEEVLARTIINTPDAPGAAPRRGAMNRIYREYWPAGDFPARTAFEAPVAHPGFMVEIECVAEIGT